MQIVADKYQVLKELGRGGSGIVYLVKHADLDVRYALKILDWQSEHDITKMCEDTWRWQCQNPNGYI